MTGHSDIPMNSGSGYAAGSCGHEDRARQRYVYKKGFGLRFYAFSRSENAAFGGYMTTVIGVRFRQAGRVYYFDPLDFEVYPGEHVIASTSHGMDYGTVVFGRREVEDSKIVGTLLPIVRPATPKDDEIMEKNHEREQYAMEVCREKIEKNNLSMKLIRAEYAFDRSKLTFLFAAEQRVDFRNLVRDLAAVFHVRIDLRQVGVRDEYKLWGGVGICGREICCHTYLTEFSAVSVKMAKEQNLSMNPSKISGNCGRLLCCLKNEEEAYEYMNSRLPELGAPVTTKDGEQGVVTELDVLKQRIKVLVNVDGRDGEEKEAREFSPEELTFKPRKRRKKQESDRELKDLENLEEKEKHHLED